MASVADALVMIPAEPVEAFTRKAMIEKCNGTIAKTNWEYLNIYACKFCSPTVNY